MHDWHIEQVSTVSDELVAATERLMPRLDSGNQVNISGAYFEKVLLNNATVWLLAKSPEGRIVGMAVLVVFELPTNIRALLENIVVDKNHQKQGVGQALISRVKQEADKRLVNTIRASTSLANAASNELLLKSGFVIEAGMNHYVYDIQQGQRL